MSEEAMAPFQQEAERVFSTKKEWHRKQAQLPLKGKVRILLQMQKDDYPILLKRGVLKSWEKPWTIEP
ncbi:MAG: hypothetical protein H7308_20520 [Chthonomonadaceae bacterium]|nr:hypothetical protein [Chthonomonadaceae bacterium]